MKLIAEIKKASPFTGELKADLNPTTQAEQYEKFGASMISVVTSSYYNGDVKWLAEVRKATQLPILRRDMIKSEADVQVSKEMGADFLLLNPKYFDNAEEMDKVVHMSWWIGVKPIVEVFFASDVTKIASLDLPRVLINSEHDVSGKIYPENRVKLNNMIGDDREMIAGTAIETRQQIIDLQRMYFDWVVVSEAFMKSTNLEETFKNIWMPNGEKQFKE